MNLFYTILSTNQVVRFSLYNWNPASPFPSRGPYTQQNMCPSPCAYAHYEDRRRCPWDYNPRSCLPFFLPISPGRAKSAYPGGYVYRTRSGPHFWGCIPRLLYRRRSTTSRMMPWRLAQRWLTKLSLPDIEQACGGGDMPLGERLLWKRSALPLKISWRVLTYSWRNIVARGRPRLVWC